MPRIHRLDPVVVNKIAAGEVIERPASVVKELLENSLDALATRIEVEIAHGGLELIRVVDNGEGVHPDDLLLTVTSHATSKIETADDLFRVQTLGFRGEALASIASVSQFRLRSRQENQPEGCELAVDGGAIGEPKPCGCPEGTQIEVRQLFYNTPVRRKFLKTTSTEFSHVTEQFTRVALAHPRLHAVLRHNGKVVYELPPTNQLLERLQLFYGAQLTDQLIWVESQTGDVRLWGFVAHPSQNKATRKGQYLFLNGRWIQDRSLQHALGEAYRGLLMAGRYPISFLFLEMPAQQVDVNVHPTKAEVRFRDSQPLYRQLLSTLRTTFLGMNLDSTLSFRSQRRDDGPKLQLSSPERQQSLQMDLAAWAKGQLAGGILPPPPEAGSGLVDPSELRSFDHSAREMDAPLDARRKETVGDFGAFPQADDDFPAAAPNRAIDSHVAPHPGSSHAPSPHAAAFRAMQIHNAYIVVESDEGLTVIDQHALHERVMYEHLRQRVLSGVLESQRMLVPVPVEVNPSQAEVLLEQQVLLAELGFGIEEFGKGTLLLNAYPVMLRRADHVELLIEIADRLAGGEQAPTRRDLLDSLLHMMSCKAAVKAGDRLAPDEMESLLAQRHLIDDAHHCPHGRPTALVLTRAELDRQFGRLGP